MDFRVLGGGGDNPIRARMRACEHFRRVLSERSGLRVELTLTRNRVSMAAVRFVGERHAQVRLHEAFVEAPEAVLLALAGYLRSRRRKYWVVVCDYARSIVVAPPARVVPCHTRGRVYDLAALADAVHQQYFGGRLEFRVGWGRRGRWGGGRSIRYGSCNVASRLIRIHPLLDDTRVPEDFVRYILYHEMLHLVIPPEMCGRRRMDHPLAFRQRERHFPDIARHRQTAKALLHLLAE